MEHQKILNLLNEASDYKFVTRKYSIANHQSNANYGCRKQNYFQHKSDKILSL